MLAFSGALSTMCGVDYVPCWPGRGRLVQRAQEQKLFTIICKRKTDRWKSRGKYKVENASSLYLRACVDLGEMGLHCWLKLKILNEIMILYVSTNCNPYKVLLHKFNFLINLSKCQSLTKDYTLDWQNLQQCNLPKCPRRSNFHP